MERKRNVSKEQIERARQLDLLSYLQQYEPQELVRVGSDSLKISHGKWFRWSTGVGGVSALDYLVKVRGMGFVEAVEQLCDCLRFEPSVKVYTPKPLKKPPFILPKPFKNTDRVIASTMRRGLGLPL